MPGRVTRPSIGFKIPLFGPFQTTQLPLSRAVFPSLTNFEFIGVRNYLEDFIARIDTHLLDQLRIAFSMVLISDTPQLPQSDTPQLYQFVGRTQNLRPLNHAQVTFSDFISKIILGSPARFVLEITWDEPDGPDQLLSSVMQRCNDHFPFISQVDQLNMYKASDLWGETRSAPPNGWSSSTLSAV